MAIWGETISSLESSIENRKALAIHETKALNNLQLYSAAGVQRKKQENLPASASEFYDHDPITQDTNETETVYSPRSLVADAHDCIRLGSRFRKEKELSAPETSVHAKAKHHPDSFR